MRLPGSGAINYYLTLPGPLRIGSPASNIGTLFLYGIAAGAVAMAGLSMLPTAGRRASHRALAMRQGTQLAWTERGNGNLRRHRPDGCLSGSWFRESGCGGVPKLTSMFSKLLCCSVLA